MFRKIIIILAVPIIAASISCTPKEVDPIQEKIKTTISELRGNVPETIIDLDKAEEITLTPAFTLSDEHLEDSGLVFADISSVHYADGTYYVTDAKQHTIFKFNHQLEHIGNIGQYGRGPVDFQQPADIIKLQDRYIIADIGNMRVQILDTELELLDVVPDIYFLMFPPHISASDDRLAVLNFDPSSDYLLRFYSTNDYSEIQKKLMPVIIYPGEMPRSLSLFQFDLNNHGTTVTAYRALPHIFVFDNDFETTHFLTLKGLEAFKPNGDYAIFPFDLPPGNQQSAMTRTVVHSLLIDEKDNIFFTSRADNTFYQLLNDSGRYTTLIKFRLEELSQNPLKIAFLTGEYLAVVDKDNATHVHFYNIHQP